MHIRRSVHLTGDIGCTRLPFDPQPARGGCAACGRAAEPLLRLPPGDRSALQHAVQAPCQRGGHGLHGLPQPPRCRARDVAHGATLRAWFRTSLETTLPAPSATLTSAAPLYTSTRLSESKAARLATTRTAARITPAESSFGLCSVPGMPQRHRWVRHACRRHPIAESVVPQPGRPCLPGLRPLSFADPRLERRSEVSPMRKHCIAYLLLCPSAFAQQPVTWSADVPASSREFSGYRMSNSFEFGYRFANVGGDHDLYRASVNFGDGLRCSEAGSESIPRWQGQRIGRVLAALVRSCRRPVSGPSPEGREEWPVSVRPAVPAGELPQSPAVAVARRARPDRGTRHADS